MASASYRYCGSLDRSQIRLLTLKPGRRQDDIRIDIKVSNLSDKPRYEALSYEWGTAEQLHLVKVSNKHINITPSLYVVLKQLRHSSQPRTLWVDAICINQDDLYEKSQQVPQMAEIYRRATSVLIWLGLQRSRSEDAFRMLSILARLWISREVKNWLEGEIRPLSWVKGSQDEASVLVPEDKSLWDTMYELMDRPYFRRTWIVQEVAVAENPRVLCGSLEISWAHFAWAAAYLSRSLYHLHESLSEHGLARINTIADLRSAYRTGQAIEISRVCFVSQTLQATDPRDKVYGFLGLLRYSFNYPAFNVLLGVDYHLPVRIVYLRAAQYSILNTRDLRICHSQAFPLERSDSSSSWAPDWSLSLDTTQAIALRLHNKIEGLSEGTINFNAEMMLVDGYQIDSISCVSAPLTSEDPLPDIQMIMTFLSKDEDPAQLPTGDILTSRDLEEVVQRLKQKTYRGSENKYEALWRTLIANTALFTTAQPSFERHFRAVIDSLRLRARGIFWECTRVCDETRMDSRSRFRLLCDVEAQRLCQRIKEQDAGPYYRELVNTIQGRVFFLTRKGHIGLGSPGILAGDSVCILKGGWTPFILRQCKGVFRMVGDSYVHGIRRERSWRRYGSKRQIMKIR